VIDRTPWVTITDHAGVTTRVPAERVALPLTVRHGRSDVGSQPDASTCSWTLLGLPDDGLTVQVGYTLRVEVHDDGSPTTVYQDTWEDYWRDVWGVPVTVTDWPALLSTRFVGQITDLETARQDDTFTTAVTAAGAMSAWAAGEPTDTAPGGTWPGSELLDSGGGPSSPDIERFLPEQTEAERTRLAMSSRNLCPDPTLSTPDYLDAMESTHVYDDDTSGTKLPLVRQEPWQDTRDACCGRRNAGRATNGTGMQWVHVPMTPWAAVDHGTATQL